MTITWFKEITDIYGPEVTQSASSLLSRCSRIYTGCSNVKGTERGFCLIRTATQSGLSFGNHQCSCFCSTAQMHSSQTEHAQEVVC